MQRSLVGSEMCIRDRLLLTPPLVLLVSTLSFQSGYSPKYTKNNGIFFNEYFDTTDLSLIDGQENLKFEDGKWLFATYASEDAELEDALYLMRQLNVALNRDINKLKRAIVIQDMKILEDQLIDYPRTQAIIDAEGKLYKKLLDCLLYTSPSPRDYAASRMPSSA